jgi:hypothetical protein
MSLTRVLQGLNATGVVWVFALTFLICADIIARTVFDAPIAGVTEIVSLSLVATVFLMVGYATHSGRLHGDGAGPGFGRFGQRHRQAALLEGRGRCAGVDGVGELEGPLDRHGLTLATQSREALGNGSRLRAGLQGDGFAFDGELDVLQPQAG